MFDAPHYKAWFNDMACFIPEGDASSVTESIRTILSGEKFVVPPVSVDESNKAVRRFDWGTLVSEFWRVAENGGAR